MIAWLWAMTTAGQPEYLWLDLKNWIMATAEITLNGEYIHMYTYISTVHTCNNKTPNHFQVRLHYVLSRLYSVMEEKQFWGSLLVKLLHFFGDDIMVMGAPLLVLRMAQ